MNIERHYLNNFYDLSESIHLFHSSTPFKVTHETEKLRGSVGRALHQQRRAHEFECRLNGLDFSVVYKRQQFKLSR